MTAPFFRARGYTAVLGLLTGCSPDKRSGLPALSRPVAETADIAG
jgi:hypothetical protein